MDMDYVSGSFSALRKLKKYLSVIIIPITMVIIISCRSSSYLSIIYNRKISNILSGGIRYAG